MTTWAEVWDGFNDPAVGNVTCDGFTGCDGAMFGLLGIIVPLLLVVGAIGLVIAVVQFKRQGGK